MEAIILKVNCKWLWSDSETLEFNKIKCVMRSSQIIEKMMQEIEIFFLIKMVAAESIQLCFYLSDKIFKIACLKLFNLLHLEY